MIFFSLLIAAVFSYIMYRKTFPEVPIRQKSLLFFLRLITLWIVLSFLLIPIYKATRVSFQKPKAVVLIDNSDSMELQQNNETKTQIVNSFLEKIKGNLEQNFDV
jgi:ABC-type glycerol-3-phosphate transport system permease component